MPKECCSVDVEVGLLLELWKLLMSQEQDSMLFCLMLVKDCGVIGSAVSISNTKGYVQTGTCASSLTVHRRRVRICRLPYMSCGWMGRGAVRASFFSTHSWE